MTEKEYATILFLLVERYRKNGSPNSQTEDGTAAILEFLLSVYTFAKDEQIPKVEPKVIENVDKRVAALVDRHGTIDTTKQGSMN